MLTFNRKKIFKVLILLTLFLVATDIARALCQFTFNRSLFLWAFSLGRDSAIPTWYSSVTLLICSLLLWTISWAKQKKHEPYIFHWRLLSGIFLVMSIDEVATIHEWIGKKIILIPRSVKSQFGGFIHYDWVIVGLFFAFCVLLFYLRFIFDLPRKTKFLFLLSGFIFISGALGVEMLVARIHFLSGTAETLEYMLLTTLEELFEMLGIATFIYALLMFTALEINEVSLNFSPCRIGKA